VEEVIDFISSNPSADSQTIACARLLAAVIAQAIEDASSRHSASGDAAFATAWLFEEGSIFEKYAMLIGADPQRMRNALLSPHDPTEIKPRLDRFDESKRRMLRQNYAHWLKRKELLRKANGS
jgi:hypothetical protein